MAATVEITVVSGDRYYLTGDAKEVERAVLDASRGAIMQLAWMVDAETGDAVGFNPAHVVAVRSVRG